MSKTSKLPVISVLGCGWFGLPFATSLVKRGYPVQGSTTSPGKLELLSAQQIVPFLVQLDAQLRNDSPDFFRCEVLVITVPPGKLADQYERSLLGIAEAAEQHGVKEVIYISSTSVMGNPAKEVFPDQQLCPDGSSAMALAHTEERLRSFTGFRTTVVRFAGLVGPNRHPGRFLAGKKDLPNGLSPVNLVHLDDCVALLTEIIARSAFGGVYHACSPDHPSRSAFYSLAATRLGMVSPTFIEERQEWKLVNGDHDRFPFSYRVNNWNDWLLTN